GAFAAGFPHLCSNGVHVCPSHRRIHRSHVNHTPALHTVQPDVATDWSGVVKIEDEPAIGSLAFFLFCQPVLSVRRNLSDLPLLALVLSEVLDYEGLNAGNA